MNRFAKDIKNISGKRNKTAADHEEIARLEWFGSLYLRQGEPCLPGELIEACIIRGAISSKRGRRAKAGVFCLDAFPLQYDGPRDPHELWKREDFRFAANAKVGMATVVRTRPIFRQWSVDIEVQYNSGLLNPDDIEEFLSAAGELEGIGDWRPRFGRFTASLI